MIICPYLCGFVWFLHCVSVSVCLCPVRPSAACGHTSVCVESEDILYLCVFCLLIDFACLCVDSS